MTEQSNITGSCVCGAVRFTALNVGAAHICHCGTCRRMSGGPAFASDPEGLAWRGTEDITVYKSSPWAERGFCRQCGTALFFRLSDPAAGYININAFLLDDQTGLSVESEIFVDEQPAFYAFAGEHPRLTGADVMAAISGTAPDQDEGTKT